MRRKELNQNVHVDLPWWDWDIITSLAEYARLSLYHKQPKIVWSVMQSAQIKDAYSDFVNKGSDG